MQQKVDDYVSKELKHASLNPVCQIKHNHPLLHILFLTSFDLVLLFFPPLEREVHLYIVGDKSKLPNGDAQSVLYVAAVVSADEKLSIFRLGGGFIAKETLWKYLPYSERKEIAFSECWRNLKC